MSTELTPQLAAADPATFRYNLINGLHKRSVYGEELWSTLLRTDSVQAGQPQIESGGWISRSNAQHGSIHLGTLPLPSTDRLRLIFDDQNINYEQEITLRLLHETGHLFEAKQIRSGSDSIQALLKTARAVRGVNRNLGLTAIGSLAFYDDSMRFREDTAELLSMYAFDPQYLRRYLSYLGDAANTAALNQVGIASVPGFEGDLFKLVESTVQEGIQR